MDFLYKNAAGGRGPDFISWDWHSWESVCTLNPRLQLPDVLEVLGSQPHILALFGFVEILRYKLSSVDVPYSNKRMKVLKHFDPDNFSIVILQIPNGHPLSQIEFATFRPTLPPLRAGSSLREEVLRGGACPSLRTFSSTRGARQEGGGGGGGVKG